MKNKILEILRYVKNDYMTADEAASLIIKLFENDSSLNISFEQCLREEFLINTQNFPKEYHELFFKKFDKAKERFENQ